MIATESNRETNRADARSEHPTKEIVELSLLLPEQQWEALELAATAEGLTTGQLLRRLIGNYLDEPFTS